MEVHRASVRRISFGAWAWVLGVSVSLIISTPAPVSQAAGANIDRPSCAAQGADRRKAGHSELGLIDSALKGTGLKSDRLLKAASGEGGPFLPANRKTKATLNPQTLARLQQVMRALPLSSPVPELEVVSGFGRRIDPINKRRAMHQGVDLAGDPKTPVLATAPGKVVFAGRNKGYGRMVEIDHGNGVTTRYAHLSRLMVHRGQMVRQGMPLGRIGRTGRTTGPHLHYEVRVDGIARDPMRFLAAAKRLAPYTGPMLVAIPKPGKPLEPTRVSCLEERKRAKKRG